MATAPPPNVPPVAGNRLDKLEELDFPFCRDVNQLYQKEAKVGQGTFGEVFKARCKKTGKLVALKKVLMENEREGFPITALREIKILQLLKHENVVTLIEICRTKATTYNRYKSTFFLVFEFCDHDLAGLLSNSHVKFTLADQKEIMKQLCDGLFYIHSSKILHRDMKAANILITKRGVLKLADFGLSRAFSNTSEPNRYTNRVVTLWYRPPELLLGERNYGPPIDMWGAGCIMAELWTRTPIMQGDVEQKQLNLITQLCGSITPEVWPDVDKLDLYTKIELPKGIKRRVKDRLKQYVKEPTALDLIDKLLTLNPEKRINAFDALDHSFFWEDPMPSRDSFARMLSQHTTSMFELLAPPRRSHGHARHPAQPGAVGGAPTQQKPGIVRTLSSEKNIIIMEFIEDLYESNIDGERVETEPIELKYHKVSRTSSKLKVIKNGLPNSTLPPAKPKRLSSKLSASFYTPNRTSGVSCTATMPLSGSTTYDTNGSISGSKSHIEIAAVAVKERGGTHVESVNQSTAANNNTVRTSEYNIEVTPIAVRTTSSSLSPRAKQAPTFTPPPPPPIEPPPSLSGTSASSQATTPRASCSDLTDSENILTGLKDRTNKHQSGKVAHKMAAAKDTRDTRSDKNLDVSAGSFSLTNSTSTEAMLHDLRRMNPTYNSDLSVNKTLTVDANLSSSMHSGTGPRSPTNKRCSTNYPMAGPSGPGSPNSPLSPISGDMIRLSSHSGRSSIDSGTSSGPHITKTQPGHFVVVAIDFGTTFSGYAFSFTQEPNSIHMMRKWEGGDPGLINQKTPTCLLLEPDGSFHSFGFSARDFYHDLDATEAKKWMYFDKFKMVLHYHADLNHDTMLTAANGEKFPAKKVFSYSLKFFKDHALRELSDQSGVKILPEDVKWVLTVPAIWKQPAKQFMREASYEAGLATPHYPDQLVIALEPEAASIYCRRLRMSQLVPDTPPPMPPLTLERNKKLEMPEVVADYVEDHLKSASATDTVGDFVQGSAYMVVDCGGGTVDITVHELAGPGGRLRELYRASGGPYGSVGVDNDFEQLMCNIFGSDFMEQFKLKRPAGYVDLMIAFESRKRSASPYKEMPLNVSLPFSFIDYYKKTKGKTVEHAIRKYGDPDVKWSAQGMLRLTQEAMRKLFMPTVLKIKESVGSVMVANSEKQIQYMFLVGGFAESPLLQLEIRKEFNSQLKVIIPQDVGLSILKGAVLFGQDPTIIHVRISRQTYGVGVLNRYVKGKHPKAKLIKRDGIQWCTDVFDKFVLTDQPVALGDTVIRSYTPAKPGQKYSIINIYTSDKTEPQFITDLGVKKAGTLQLDLTKLPSSASRKRREIQCRMEFGDTEVKVAAVDLATGAIVKANIDFLGK